MSISIRMAAELERFRAVFAATTDLAADQLPSPKPRRAVQAAPKTSKARALREPPALSRQYMRAISTRVVLDQRLTANAVRLVSLIVALAGRSGTADTTRARLAARLGLHVRSVARLLSDLRQYGYIAVSRVLNAIGADIGLRVILKPCLYPYYLLESQGVTHESSLKDSSLNRSFSVAETDMPFSGKIRQLGVSLWDSPQMQPSLPIRVRLATNRDRNDASNANRHHARHLCDVPRNG